MINSVSDIYRKLDEIETAIDVVFNPSVASNLEEVHRLLRRVKKVIIAIDAVDAFDGDDRHE